MNQGVGGRVLMKKTKGKISRVSVPLSTILPKVAFQKVIIKILPVVALIFQFYLENDWKTLTCFVLFKTEISCDNPSYGIKLTRRPKSIIFYIYFMSNQ
jgi:hypothetical protein